MNFSDTESSHEESSLREDQKEKKDAKVLLSVCTAVWCIKTALQRARSVSFAEKAHASAYNAYMREREKLGGKKADTLSVFEALLKIGVRCRIVYSVSVSTEPQVLEALEILVGNNVVTEGDTRASYISLSVSYDGTVTNHSLYLPKSISKALSEVFPHGSTAQGCFGEHDRKNAETLPRSKKEALLHPLYTIERHRPRELIYPRGCGWVGTVPVRERAPPRKPGTNTSASTSTEGGSSTDRASCVDADTRRPQKKKELRVYPMSHKHRLLTAGEIASLNKSLESNAVPFRVCMAKESAALKKRKMPVKLYAPWQIHSNPPALPALLVPRDIPEGSMYLIETDHVVYLENGAEESASTDTAPMIGREYNPSTGRMEPVHAGMLITKDAFHARKKEIKKAVLQNIIRQALASKHAFLLNLQVLSSKALEYLDILDSLHTEQDHSLA
ncbi:hypothetical protein NECID01_0574 [Nematocida sp. AWRm77]|nr:hypothetical protein NECID01_0574 [Nematocida sp. AWRm77]